MLTGQHLGRYEIRSIIGKGGMGEVYSAHDSELDRNVAIKILPSEFTTDPDRKVRFRQEARAVSALNHPNIITIYEIGEDEHGSFLATEFVDGRTLREVLQNESLNLSRSLRIIKQIANALVAAHAAGIVHRDIKPENIMLRRDSIVKVLDFGLAKQNENIFRDDSSGNNITDPGMVLGSARYMSPEQSRGLEVDARTDIWSLGVVLYELVTGKVPFDGNTAADTLAAVIYEEHEPIWRFLPNAPLELQRIVRKALQKDREERYQSVKDFALDIRDLLHELEHTDSGKRSAHTSTQPNFSENPTIIRRADGSVFTSDQNPAFASNPNAGRRLGKLRSPLLGLAVLAGVVVLLFAGAGVYEEFSSQAPLAVGAFARPQISRINTDGRVSMPSISPDGKYVAYVAGEFGSRNLVVRQIATDSVVSVVPPTNLNFTSLTFSPTGDYIYYCLSSTNSAVKTLYRVPALGGAAKKLVEDVDSGVTFSPDGKQFAFIRHRPETNDDVVFVVNSESLAGEPLLISKDAGYDFFSMRLAWSPDGQKILLGAGRRQGGFVSSTHLAEINVSERTMKALKTRDFYAVTSVAWFSDGSGFLFTARETQNSQLQIWRSTYPEPAVEQVTSDFNDYTEASVTADGRALVTLKADTVSSIWKYSPTTKSMTQFGSDSRNMHGAHGLVQTADGSVIYTHNEGKETDLWIVDREGKNARPLLAEPGYAVSPVVTPDGRHLIYNLQKDKSSRIWKTDPDGTNAVALTEENANFADFSPQVTPDGRFIVFQRMLVDADRSVLARIPIDGGAVETVFESEGLSIYQPRVSPDGKRIAFMTFDIRSFQKKLLIAAVIDNKFGSIEREIENNLINQYLWSPDSRSLTISTNRAGAQNLWRQPIDGSPAKPLTDFNSGKIMNYAWTSDGRELLISRGNTNNDLIIIRDGSREDSPATATYPANRRRTAFEIVAGVFDRFRY
ncbi:MAG: protein kinase domain-containing protein [Pyrinomonadaceae bacterium]